MIRRPGSMEGFSDPEREVRMAWGWNHWEIVDYWRRGRPCWPWMASHRDLNPDDPVLPIVLPIRGAA